MHVSKKHLRVERRKKASQRELWGAFFIAVRVVRAIYLRKTYIKIRLFCKRLLVKLSKIFR